MCSYTMPTVVSSSATSRFCWRSWSSMPGLTLRRAIVPYIGASSVGVCGANRSLAVVHGVDDLEGRGLGSDARRLQRCAELVLEEALQRLLRLPNLHHTPAGLGRSASVVQHARRWLVIRRDSMKHLLVLVL